MVQEYHSFFSEVPRHFIEAVFLEHLQGLDNLPTVYVPYFLTPLEKLLKKPITQLKQWFLVVRSGRESIEPNRYKDIFATDTSLRSWINLTTKRDFSHQTN